MDKDSTSDKYPKVSLTCSATNRSHEWIPYYASSYITGKQSALKQCAYCCVLAEVDTDYAVDGQGFQPESEHNPCQQHYGGVG